MRKKINYIFTFTFLILYLTTTSFSQIIHPSVSINQNGHFNISTTLTGATFEMVITNYCSEVHNLYFVYNEDDLEFLGGVRPDLYTIDGNFIYLKKEGTGVDCESYVCEPMQLVFLFRFKQGQCQTGPLSGFGYSYSNDCYDGSEPPPFPAFKIITAIANDYWQLKVIERSPNQFLPTYEKEWELRYYQDFTGATPVNGITPTYGIGTLDLEVENVNVNLAVSNCTDPDYEVTGYTERYYFNANIPNVPYEPFTGGPNIDGSYDYVPDSGYTSLSSVDDQFPNYYFFVKGKVIICDEEEECDYTTYFSVDGKLGNDCDSTILIDSVSGTIGYEQIVLASLGSLSKTITVGAYRHLAPGCTGVYTIRFENRGLTDITTLQITDYFPAALSYNIGDITTFPSAIFDINTSGGDIIFDLLPPNIIAPAGVVFITIPFSIPGIAIPGTPVTNGVEATFDAEFPSDVTYDQCGNPVMINAETGVATPVSVLFNIDEPQAVSGVIKCVDNAGSINVGDEQDFTIYMINNGAEGLNTTLTDFFDNNNLVVIPASISYSSNTIASTTTLNCNTSYNLDPGLDPGFSAVFDDEDSWEIEIPANCNYDELSILAISFTATQLPAQTGTNCAKLGQGELDPVSCVEYGINRLGQLKIEKFANSGVDEEDWATEQALPSGTIFQYKIEVTNNGSVRFNEEIVIRDELPECVDLISTSASINGSPVTVGGTAPYYEFDEELDPGQTLEFIITAEYLGGEDEDCLNTACARVSTSLSEDFLTSCSDSVSIIDPCTLVDIDIRSTYVQIVGSNIRCCFRLQYLNMYPQTDVFTHIGYSASEPVHVVNNNGFSQSLSGGYVLYEPNPPTFIPNNLTPQPFIEVCIQQGNLPRTIDFEWFDSGDIICTSPLIFARCEGPLLKEGDLSRWDAEGLEMLVYPNPTKSLLNIHINKEEEKGHILIFGADGKVVYDRNSDFYSGTTALDIAGLTDGLYMLKLTLPSGVTQIVKFVKMN